MLIVGVLCLCAAVLCAVGAVRSLTRPRNADPALRALRALAVPQLAAAALLATGGAIALATGSSGLFLVLGCVAVAVLTVAIGSWQSARFALAQGDAEPAGCTGSCASCTLSCD